jgi:glycerol-3-phosphate O-acyltransferase
MSTSRAPTATTPSLGLRMLTLRHLVIETDDTYRANPKELVLLQYYANAIAHLFKDGEPRTG